MNLFKKFLKAYSKQMGKQEDPNLKILKERNFELEETIKKLSIQLEKSKKNVKNLTSKRQEVEEKLNT